MQQMATIRIVVEPINKKVLKCTVDLNILSNDVNSIVKNSAENLIRNAKLVG